MAAPSACGIGRTNIPPGIASVEGVGPAEAITGTDDLAHDDTVVNEDGEIVDNNAATRASGLALDAVDEAADEEDDNDDDPSVAAPYAFVSV